MVFPFGRDVYATVISLWNTDRNICTGLSSSTAPVSSLTMLLILVHTELSQIWSLSFQELHGSTRQHALAIMYFLQYIFSISKKVLFKCTWQIFKLFLWNNKSTLLSPEHPQHLMPRGKKNDTQDVVISWRIRGEISFQMKSMILLKRFSTGPSHWKW